jgi:hypothetical protein
MNRRSQGITRRIEDIDPRIKEESEQITRLYKQHNQLVDDINILQKTVDDYTKTTRFAKIAEYDRDYFKSVLDSKDYLQIHELLESLKFYHDGFIKYKKHLMDIVNEMRHKEYIKKKKVKYGEFCGSSNFCCHFLGRKVGVFDRKP